MLKKLFAYFSSVIEEFKKIKYPEKKEVIAMSISVLVGIFIISIFCLSIDSLFISMINLIILS